MQSEAHARLTVVITLGILTMGGAGVLHMGGIALAADYDGAPIHYESAQEDNVLFSLAKRLEENPGLLQYDKKMGYLPAMLKEMNVPVSSQLLVYSKTSLQRERISPKNPRAIYFNDELYVGYIPRARFLELSAMDPQLGAVFYTLEQRQSDSPRLMRHGETCLACHATSGQTHGVPGQVVRSVFVDDEGIPLLASGTKRVDHTTPLKDRWGGWYVTGLHGTQVHLGNQVFGREDDDAWKHVDYARGSNLTSIADRINAENYPSPHSDLVALMVFEHQAEAHNLFTQANFQTRLALQQEAAMNREMNMPEDHRWQSTTTRIRAACDDLFDYLTFKDEAAINEPLEGSGAFRSVFESQGAGQEDNARRLDLKRRLFAGKVSYLADSRMFQGLPEEARIYLQERLTSFRSRSIGVDQPNVKN